MGVQQHYEQKTTAPAVLSALLKEFSAISDCHTLQENLPRRLADLLNCRCVLLYMRVGETLQFTAGSFEDTPGWSASLLTVAHINPIRLNGDLPEARAWGTRQVIAEPVELPTLLAAPLIYRQRAIGVLVALCGEEEGESGILSWQETSSRPSRSTPRTMLLHTSCSWVLRDEAWAGTSSIWERMSSQRCFKTAQEGKFSNCTSG